MTALHPPYQAGQATGFTGTWHIVNRGRATVAPYTTLCGKALTIRASAFTATLPESPTICPLCVNAYRVRTTSEVRSTPS